MDTIEVDGVHLRASDQGEGAPPVALLHGGYDRLEDVATPLAGLAASWRVIAYDRRGCGDSSGDKDPTTHEVWGDDLVSVLDALGASPAVLCGVSFGAMTALDVAIRHPEHVAGLVLIAGTAREFVPSPGWNVHFPDRRGQLATIDTPTLVVHGDEDDVFPHEHGAEMAEGIPGAALHTVSGGHDIHRLASDEVEHAIKGFLKDSFDA